MENNHVILALRRKRAELAGLIPEVERRLNSLRQAMAGVDTTLLLFDPLADPENIKPRRTYKRQQVFAHKELSRLVMGALREASGPIPTLAIVASVAAVKGLEAEQGIVAKQVSNALRALLKRGVVVRTEENGSALWERAG